MTALEARTNYPNGWYVIEMKDGPPLIRFFQDGESYLCDPQEFFSPRIMAMGGQITSAAAELQMAYVESCQEMIKRGPVAQYDPSMFAECASFPQLFQRLEVQPIPIV